MEKKRSRQIEEILAAIGAVSADVAGLKTAIASPEVTELETMEVVDRHGEILSTIVAAFAETREQLDRSMSACAAIAQEVIKLQAEVRELKAQFKPATKGKK